MLERQIEMPGSEESVATQREKTMCDQVACLLRRCKNVGDAVGNMHSLSRSHPSCGNTQILTYFDGPNVYSDNKRSLYRVKLQNK